MWQVFTFSKIEKKKIKENGHLSMSTHQKVCGIACEYAPRGHTESDADFVGEFS